MQKTRWIFWVCVMILRWGFTPFLLLLLCVVVLAFSTLPEKAFSDTLTRKFYLFGSPD